MMESIKIAEDADDSFDEDYLLMEEQADNEVKAIEGQIQNMGKSESSLHLRQKVGDYEEEYLQLQKECKEIAKKQKEAVLLKIEQGLIESLEEALALKEDQLEIKGVQLGKLNNLLQEVEYNAIREESKH